jgi:hypothetical protein
MWRVALPLAWLALSVPVRVDAQARTEAASANVPVTTEEARRGVIAEAWHRCVFNRPCNWTGHATLAMGVVWGLDRLSVRTDVAAIAAALVFVGKEVRDDRKWGHVLGSTDSMGDMLSGFLGAYVGYRLFRERRRNVLLATDAARTTVTVRIPVP